MVTSLRSRIELDRPGAQPIRDWRPHAAANDRAEPREQLVEVERLRQVVVCTAVEAGDAGLHGVTRRQHQNRHRGSGGTELPAHAQPIERGQNHVEDDGVVLGGLRAEDRRTALCRHVDGVGLLTKPLGQEPCGLGLVFDQQDPHGSIVAQSTTSQAPERPAWRSPLFQANAAESPFTRVVP